MSSSLCDAVAPLIILRCLWFTYPVLAIVSKRYSRHRGRLLMYYSPVRRSLVIILPKLPNDSLARLACIRHAASVHPEPGSNSPFDIIALNFFLLFFSVYTSF